MRFDPDRFWANFLLVSQAEAFRYFLVALFFALVTWWLAQVPAFRSRIQAAGKPPGQLRRELLLSFSSIGVFALIFPLLLLAGLGPHMQFYRNIGDHGWPYFVLSIFMMMAVQDAWFYWTHRLMHHRRLFRFFHRTHHLTTNPTPWTTYSIHPLEAIVDSGGNVVILFLFPAHGLALFIFSWINTLYAVYGHLGFELFPRGTARHWLGRWINTSVAHNAHHERARYNYGWYTLFWDRLFGTLDPDYEARYARAFPARA